MAIFDQPQDIGGAFTAEDCGLSGDGLGDGAVVQRVQFQIERPINFIYEIGSPGGKNFVYYVGNRRRGQATFERVVGGAKDFKKFVENYGQLCKKTADIELTAKGGCDLGAGLGQEVIYTLKSPKLTGLGVNVTAEQVIILENVQLAFLDLDYAPKGGGGGGGVLGAIGRGIGRAIGALGG